MGKVGSGVAYQLVSQCRVFIIFFFSTLPQHTLSPPYGHIQPTPLTQTHVEPTVKHNIKHIGKQMRMTGERFLELLAEAEEHRTAFKDLRQAVQESCRQNLHLKEMRELLELVNILHELPSNEVMLRERSHFTTHQQRNHGEKLRMRRKRELQQQFEGDKQKTTEHLSDEELAEQLREQGIMPPRAIPAPQPVPAEPTLAGAEQLKASQERTQMYDGKHDIFATGNNNVEEPTDDE